MHIKDVCKKTQKFFEKLSKTKFLIRFQNEEQKDPTHG